MGEDDSLGGRLVKFGKKGVSAPDKAFLELIFGVSVAVAREKGGRRKSTCNNGGNESTMTMTRAGREDSGGGGGRLLG